MTYNVFGGTLNPTLLVTVITNTRILYFDLLISSNVTMCVCLHVCTANSRPATAAAAAVPLPAAAAGAVSNAGAVAHKPAAKRHNPAPVVHQPRVCSAHLVLGMHHPDFSSNKSGIRPFVANLAKFSPGRNYTRL